MSTPNADVPSGQQGERGKRAVVRPQPLTVNASGIPQALWDRDRWVLWRYHWEAGKDGRGGWKKPPYSLRTGKRASVTDIAVGVPLKDALHSLAAGKFDGVGLILRDERTEAGDLTLYVLDIDHCRDAVSGEIDAEAQAIVRRLNSYTEVSPSGTGLHIFFFGSLPTLGSRVGRYEVYGAGRYLTVTGLDVPIAMHDVMRREHEAADVCFDLKLTQARRLSPLPSLTAAKMSDEEVIDRCSRGPGAGSFLRLLAGQNLHHNSDSEADLSLCSRLAFYTQDHDQIETLWRASKRWREKCDSHPAYVGETIAKAIRTKSAYFAPDFRKGTPGALATSESKPGLAATDPPSGPIATTPPPTPTCVRPDKSQEKGQSSANRIVRRVADIKHRKTSYVVPGLIPRAELSLLVGPANCGKSTCVAWVLSHVLSAVLLPGNEESIDALLVPRLAALCPSLDGIRTLEGLDWTLPSNAKHLEAQVLECKAELVVLDPIDSYLDDGLGENNAQAVRPMLEALTGIAHRTGAAVLGVRHTGRARGNTCPGSRAWRAVPRMVIELIPGCDFPPRRILRLDKDSLGARTPPTYYDLLPLGPDQPCRFVLGTSVSRLIADVAADVTERVERRKLDVACGLLRQWLAEGEQESSWILKTAQGLGLSGSTMYNAADRLGVVKRTEGGGKNLKHFWAPPASWPEERPESNTGGGGCV